MELAIHFQEVRGSLWDYMVSLGVFANFGVVCGVSRACSILGCFLGVDDSQGPQPKLRSVTFKSVGKSDQVYNGNNEDGNIL